MENLKQEFLIEDVENHGVVEGPLIVAFLDVIGGRLPVRGLEHVQGGFVVADNRVGPIGEDKAETIDGIEAAIGSTTIRKPANSSLRKRVSRSLKTPSLRLSSNASGLRT